MIYEPYAYQAYAEDFILNNPEAGLFLDMGMGKTAITLSAAEKLMRDYFIADKVLVIAPLEPAKNTWPNELRKWEHLNGLSVSLIIGSAEERRKGIETEADIYIVNRENVVWLVDYWKKRWPYEIVVIDELSSFKSTKAQRFRALRKVRKYIKRIVGLTGTPGDLLSLWPQVYLLDEGKSLGRTITGYREQYFDPDKRNATTIFSWKPKEKAAEQIYKKLDGLCVSMKGCDYLDLPEQLMISHEVALTKKTMQNYRILERDSVLALAGGDIDACTAAVLANKLLQFCGGFVYDENGQVIPVHDEKLKKLDQLIEEANGQPVLLFYGYKSEKVELLRRYPDARDIKEPGVIDSWNAGEVPILIAHPASAGHGLNLQHGGHIIVWYSLPWSLELYQQANKRLHRLGQTETVLVHHILIQDALDGYILNTVLAKKEMTQNGLLDALRVRIEEVTA